MAEARVTLREITPEMVIPIVKLAVAESQKGFVAPNAVSLAQALLAPEAWYRAIYAGDEPVGFVMVADESQRTPAPEKPTIGLWRLMIDARHQGKGYGREALLQVIEQVRAKGLFERFELSYVPGPGCPEPFYRSLGFVDAGRMDGDEVVIDLDLGRVAAANGAGTGLALEELGVESDGIALYVRNKRPAGVERFAGEKIVLYLHGSTYPAESSFDLRVGGTSWMEHIARRGYDVYLMDARGFGRSGPLPQMHAPATENAPLAVTEEAVRDVAAVVEAIRRRRGVERINLMAWSWGTRVMQWYASLNPEKVAKLVLYGPGYTREGPALIPPVVGAYRVVTPEDARTRWLTGVPADKVEGLIPPGWFEAWAEATFTTEREGGRVLLTPNGAAYDGERYWSKGIVPWDPAAITAPVLLVRGEWDRDTPAYMSQSLFAALANARSKRYVEVGGGTHALFMEARRGELFREVQLFLDEEIEGSGKP